MILYWYFKINTSEVTLEYQYSAPICPMCLYSANKGS